MIYTYIIYKKYTGEGSPIKKMEKAIAEAYHKIGDPSIYLYETTRP